MSAKLWAIVKREYIERVRTKAFVIGTILGPLRDGGDDGRAGACRALQGQAAARGRDRRDRRAARRPSRRRCARPRSTTGARFDVQPEHGRAARRRRARGSALKQAVLDKRLDGYLALPADAVCHGARRATTGATSANRSDLRTMERTVGARAGEPAPRERGLDPGKVKDLTRELGHEDDPALGARASARTRAPLRSWR